MIEIPTKTDNFIKLFILFLKCTLLLFSIQNTLRNFCFIIKRKLKNDGDEINANMLPTNEIGR